MIDDWTIGMCDRVERSTPYGQTLARTATRSLELMKEKG